MSTLLFDPTHKVWDIEDRINEWTIINTDARRHIQQAIQQLMELGHIDIACVHKSEDSEAVDVNLTVGE